MKFNKRNPVKTINLTYKKVMTYNYDLFTPLDMSYCLLAPMKLI